jgi:hypothetical protein
MELQDVISVLNNSSSSIEQKCEAMDMLHHLEPEITEGIIDYLLLALENREYIIQDAYYPDETILKYVYVRERAIFALAKVAPNKFIDRVVPVMTELINYPYKIREQPSGETFIEYINFPVEVATSFGENVVKTLQDAISRRPSGIPRDAIFTGF